MRHTNKVFIGGNITNDATVNSTKTETQIMSFQIACHQSRKTKDGEEVEHVNFINCIVWGDNKIRYLLPKLTRGTEVVIEGSLYHSQWEKDGEKRNKIQVNVEHVTIIRAKDMSGKFVDGVTSNGKDLNRKD